MAGSRPRRTRPRTSGTPRVRRTAGTSPRRRPPGPCARPPSPPGAGRGWHPSGRPGRSWRSADRSPTSRAGRRASRGPPAPARSPATGARRWDRPAGTRRSGCTASGSRPPARCPGGRTGHVWSGGARARAPRVAHGDGGEDARRGAGHESASRERRPRAAPGASTGFGSSSCQRSTNWMAPVGQAPPQRLAERARLRPRLEVGADGVEGAGLDALAALDARRR